MSGMLGAIAIASVKASRQAEGGGGAAVFGSAFFSSAAADGSDGPPLADGASTGRGLGNGTLAAAMALASAKGVGPQQTNTSAVAVTMATPRKQLPTEAHLRRALPALDFVSNRAKQAEKAFAHSGGTSPCWD